MRCKLRKTAKSSSARGHNPMIRPSPQIGAQIEGSPEQLQPSSTVHDAEQPSSVARLMR